MESHFDNADIMTAIERSLEDEINYNHDIDNYENDQIRLAIEASMESMQVGPPRAIEIPFKADQNLIASMGLLFGTKYKNLNEIAEKVGNGCKITVKKDKIIIGADTEEAIRNA